MRILVAFTLAFAVFAAPGSRALSQTTDRFVTPAGGGDCSQAAPCSLAAALATPVLTGTIYLAAGVYTSALDPVASISDTSRLVGGWDGAAAGDVLLSADPAATVLDGQALRRVVHVITGSVELNNLTIRGGRVNAATQPSPAQGAGVLIDNGALTLNAVAVISNVSSGTGAGVAVGAAELVVTATTFSGNRAQQGGGAVWVSSAGRALVSDSRLTDNDASFGAAIAATGPLSVTRSRLERNTGTSAISVIGVPAMTHVANNILVRNTGGAVTIYSGPGQVLHNTFDANNIDVSANFSAVVTVTNNIMVFGLGRAIEAYNRSVITASNNLFFFNAANMITGTNIVVAYPRFASQSAGDYRIVGGSPALDAGVEAGVADDFAHKPRPVRGGPDIGAYEEDVDAHAGVNLLLPLVSRRR